MERTDGYAPVGDYAVLSDQRTAALVASDGAIDWMCAPRFDDPPLFGRLLDPGAGGVFVLRPAAAFATSRRYVEDTNVLETTWTTASGVVRLTDALVVSAGVRRFSEVLRRVECLSGEVALEWEVRPRFGWDHRAPRVRRCDAGVVLAHEDLELLVQSLGLGDPRERDGAVAGGAVLRDGDSAILSALFVHDFPLLGTTREAAERRLEETAAFWRGWVAPLRYEGPWAAAVRRSVLALGACVHDQTGALVAAPTTSLPERIGGDRNYDYRYCWVRDTSFALDATLGLGLTELAQATFGWLMRAGRRTHPRIAVYFDLDSEPTRPEVEVPLPGYRGSLPVRVGNDAGTQLQLGNYSDLLETAWLFADSGNPLDERTGVHLAEAADHVCRIWRRPDSGIWELNRPRTYTRSRIACWEALDCATHLAAAGQIPGTSERRWRDTMAEIRRWVEAHSVVDGVFRRDGDGSDELDCAELLLAHSPFLERDDPRLRATVERIAIELDAGGPLLYRFTGAQEIENAFVACSFWMVTALDALGRRDEAAERMDAMVALTNDVGLLAEQIDPTDRSFAGNTPQCFSHLALLNTALSLTPQVQDEQPRGSRAA